MKISKNWIVAILLLAQLTIAADPKDFCWKDSYGRGAGTVPGECGPNRDKMGAFCYDRCPQGYSRKGFDCAQECPPHLRDDGLFCRAAQYGRGAGFRWRARDGVNRRTRDNGMISRCEAQHGRGNCEKNGAIYYPKCRPGFYAAGCCICRPHAPDCNALGLGGRFDLSCAKKLVHTRPQAGGCPSDRVYDAGLCYPSCRQNFHGVGPVCWSFVPKGWVDCGAAAARSQAACGNAVGNQVLKTLIYAGKIAAAASSRNKSAAIRARDAAKAAGKEVGDLEEVIKAFDWPLCSQIEA